MNELSVHIITQSKDLPVIEGNDLFHSRERFLLIDRQPARGLIWWLSLTKRGG